MDARYREQLEQADDLEHWDWPPDFDLEEGLQRIEELRPRLELVIGHELILDTHIQDAAHFAELAWRSEPRDLSSFETGYILTYVGILFSAFGRLVTVWGNVPEAPIHPDMLKLIEAILNSAGYHPIPLDVLDEPYYGNHQFADSIQTWWHRFFDYC